MSKRRVHSRCVYCSHAGCTDFARYEYSTRRDYDDAVRRNTPWTCLRHSGTVLSPDSPIAVWVSEPNAYPKGYPRLKERFFGHSGFISAAQIYAWAKDFPEGTRIRITVEAMPPSTEARLESEERG